MKVHFLGGANEVGASCLLLEMAGLNILVDAGIRPSLKVRDGLSGEILPDLSILSRLPPDAVIVTHAHADHIGGLPVVFSSYPNVPLYATPPTISLMNVMYKDAMRIIDARAEAENDLPPYDELQVQQAEAASRPADFRREFSLNGKVNVTFYRAGHIPGAVSAFFQSDEGTILVSGDISFSAMRATPVAEIPPVTPDILILESTYGGKLHANRVAEEQRLIDSVTRIVEQGGRVLIPAFALGRAQEVALILDAAMAAKKMPIIPVYLDGMTRVITQVFERFPDYLSKGLQRHLEESQGLFRTKNINLVMGGEERGKILHDKQPSLIIASSGMLIGGASAEYATAIVKEKQSAIFITGYQDEESPGRALQNLANKETKTLILRKRKYTVECEIGTYSLSAHADENELTQYAAQLEPKMVYLVHGEAMARERMRDLLTMRQLKVHLPRIGEEVEVIGSRALGRRLDAPQIPEFVTLPISDLADLNFNLPLYNASGELYVQNARKLVMEMFPADQTGLRDVKFSQPMRTVKLTFDFPQVAATKYAEKLEKLRQVINWEVELNKGANSIALQKIAEELNTNMLGRASIYINEEVVQIVLKEQPENWSDIQQAYQERTGFRLMMKGEKSPAAPAEVSTLETIRPEGADEPMEINAAYTTLKNIFSAVGMYKAGMKGDTIVLSFMTPELGQRFAELMQEVATMIGHPLSIHPHPNQHALIEYTNTLCRENKVTLIKNPSLNIAEKSVTVDPGETLAPELVADMISQFEDSTGWTLVVKSN